MIKNDTTAIFLKAKSHIFSPIKQKESERTEKTGVKKCIKGRV